MRWLRYILACIVAICPGAHSSDAESLPNIVLVLADDLGYGDVRAYNPQSKIDTPNIDRMARQGMRWVDAHSASTCVPSRYQLLTGRYRFRADRDVEREGLIEPGQITLASLLKNVGYTTAMIGKWHLGFEGLGVNRLHDAPSAPFDYDKPLRGGPVDHGFDSYFGIYASLDVAPYFFVKNDRVVKVPDGVTGEHHTPGFGFIQGEFWRGGQIASDFKHAEVLPRTADLAVRYLEDRAEAQQPFFLYVALTAPHAPWLPADNLRHRSSAGMYGDFVMQVDEEIGRLLMALEKIGKTRNTMFIVTSDNGPSWYEADVDKYGHRASGSWRGMKADAWEGGHRIPFIVRWPAKIPANASTEQLFSFTDMLATFASLTGQKLPEGAGEDSFDILPILLGKSSRSIRQTIIHEARGPNGDLLAVRQGNWKLIPSSCDVSMLEGLGRDGKYTNPCPQVSQDGEMGGQLYDLSSDPSERRNVYAEHPAIVQQLTKLLDKYRKANGSSVE